MTPIFPLTLNILFQRRSVHLNIMTFNSQEKSKLVQGLLKFSNFTKLTCDLKPFEAGNYDVRWSLCKNGSSVLILEKMFIRGNFLLME